jgi:hypothetical protein
MTTLYTHKSYYRDDGRTAYGRWGENKSNACRGNGFGIGYDKGLYHDPVEESCSSGGPVMKMEKISALDDDPNLEIMRKANAESGDE